MNKQTWYVYLLECSNGTYYCGVTNNVEKRMKTHQEGTGSKYVHRHGFKKLLHTKECKNKSDACKCEWQIKQLPRNKKQEWFTTI